MWDPFHKEPQLEGRVKNRNNKQRAHFQPDSCPMLLPSPRGATLRRPPDQGEAEGSLHLWAWPWALHTALSMWSPGALVRPGLGAPSQGSREQRGPSCILATPSPGHSLGWGAHMETGLCGPISRHQQFHTQCRVFRGKDGAGRGREPRVWAAHWQRRLQMHEPSFRGLQDRLPHKRLASSAVHA